jgi:hypothetical protein
MTDYKGLWAPVTILTVLLVCIYAAVYVNAEKDGIELTLMKLEKSHPLILEYVAEGKPSIDFFSWYFKRPEVLSE